MNAIFDKWVEYGIENPFGWAVGRFRYMAINMDEAGPTAGSRKAATVADFASGARRLQQFTTQWDHGFVAGDKVSIFGVVGTAPTFVTNSAYVLGRYTKPAPANGKRYKCVVAGTTGNAQPTWPTTDGAVVVSGTTAWLCDGPDSNHVANGIWTVDAVQLTTQFTVDTNAPYFYNSGGYVAKLSGVTYLTDFAPLNAARMALSDPLPGRTVTRGLRLGAGDAIVDFSDISPSEVLILLKTASLYDDVDVVDTQQRLVSYIDSAAALPLQSTLGLTTLMSDKGANKQLRI